MLWSACGPSNFTRRGRTGERNYMYVCASPSLVFSSVQLFNVLISSLYQFMFSFPPCSPPLSLSLCTFQLGLHSDRATFIKHSKFSREQEVLLQEEISYNSAWSVSPAHHILHILLVTGIMRCRKFLCFRQDERLETEGTPVPVSLSISACVFPSLYTSVLYMYVYFDTYIPEYMCMHI